LEELLTKYGDIFAMKSDHYGWIVYRRIDKAKARMLPRRSCPEEERGDLCFCIDYRKLNDVRRKACFPLPRSDGTLDTVAGAKWFFTLDQKNSYWQVNLHPDERRRLPY
jgi:hypothetical protein